MHKDLIPQGCSHSKPYLLEAHNLGHSFDYQLYEDVNFKINPGESLSILGISGTGKSTILNHLSTMLKPKKGKVNLLDFDDVYSLDSSTLIHIRRNYLGIIFQAHYLFNGFNALENLMVASLLSKKPIYKSIIEPMGINHVLLQNAGDLSGGQQQRLSIARILCKQPKIILADEPTGNLDSHTARIVIDCIFEYIQKFNAGLVLATHDEELAYRCTQTYVLKEKRLKKLNL